MTKPTPPNFAASLPKAEQTTDAGGETLYTCPGCGNKVTMDQCDAIGADDGCLFCNKCCTEFHT